MSPVTPGPCGGFVLKRWTALAAPGADHGMLISHFNYLLQIIRVEHVVVIDKDKYVRGRFANPSQTRVSEPQFLFPDVPPVCLPRQIDSLLEWIIARVIYSQVCPVLLVERL